MPEVTSVREPRIYSKDSPHSYFADVARSASPLSKGYTDAKSRLQRHAVELAGEIRANEYSPEAKYAVRSMQNIVRSNDPGRAEAEFRAMSSGAGSGGSWVTPQYLVQEYHEFREYPPAFLEQLPCQPLPEYGMTVNIPMLEGPAAVVAQAAEGNPVGETDPTAGYHNAALATYSGQILVSQQLLDRTGPSLTFDSVAYKQMRQEYDAAVDAATITAALAGAQTVTNAGTFGIPGLFGDLYNARAKLETAAGTKLRPTHAFFLPTPWGFIASQCGTDNRPILLPHAAANVDMPMRVGMDDLAPGGYTGYAFGGVPAFTDGSIPLTGGNATIILLNSSSVYPFVQQEPTAVSYVETKANDLQVVIRLHGYAASVITHANGVCAISGAAYSATPVFLG